MMDKARKPCAASRSRVQQASSPPKPRWLITTRNKNFRAAHFTTLANQFVARCTSPNTSTSSTAELDLQHHKCEDQLRDSSKLEPCQCLKHTAGHLQRRQQLQRQLLAQHTGPRSSDHLMGPCLVAAGALACSLITLQVCSCCWKTCPQLKLIWQCRALSRHRVCWQWYQT